MDRRQSWQELLVFFLLVGIGVAGRWGQPEWCFTPTAAVAIFSGFYFGFRWRSLMAPILVLAISDLTLPAYDSRAVMITVYFCMVLPVSLGWLLRYAHGRWAKAAAFAMGGVLPATAFFLTTNWAVWYFKSDYEPTIAGLAECYARAVPFFRMMLVGDLFYLTVLMSCHVLALAMTPLQRAPALESKRRASP